MKNNSIRIFLIFIVFQTNILLALDELSYDSSFKAITELQKHTPTAQWVAWKVKLKPGHRKICCTDWYSNSGRSIPSICNLEDTNFNSIQLTNKHQSIDEDLTIYLKVADNKAQKIKAVSNSCQVDIGKNEVIWLNNISGKNSVAFIMNKANDIETDIQRNQLIEALAYHSDNSATSGLISLHEKYDTNQHYIELMLTSMHGEQGLDFVIKQFHNQSSLKLKEERVFSISQSPLPKAQSKIVNIAQFDKSDSLRKNATFWISQMDIENSADLIMKLIKEEPNPSVRLEAVFALGQVANGKGLPYLEKLIRQSKDSEVRQKALFWLTESDEEKAMLILESILGG